jgi:hypothetical protein
MRLRQLKKPIEWEKIRILSGPFEAAVPFYSRFFGAEWDAIGLFQLSQSHWRTTAESYALAILAAPAMPRPGKNASMPSSVPIVA